MTNKNSSFFDDQYNLSEGKAKQHKKLYHYTTLSALESILTNKTLRLSRLDLVNDKNENARVEDIHKFIIFVFCFTHKDKESLRFWKEYARESEGVLLEFDNKIFLEEKFDIFSDDKCKNKFELYKKNNVTNNANQEWFFLDFTFADIIYTKNFSSYEEEDKVLKEFFSGCTMIGKKKNFTFTQLPGLVKGIEWADEKESRLRIALKYKGPINIKDEIHIPPFEYIYIKLSYNVFNNLTITMNPWHNKAFEEKLKTILDNTNLNNIKIKESSMRVNSYNK